MRRIRVGTPRRRYRTDQKQQTLASTSNTSHASSLNKGPGAPPANRKQAHATKANRHRLRTPRLSQDDDGSQTGPHNRTVPSGVHKCGHNHACCHPGCSDADATRSSRYPRSGPRHRRAAMGGPRNIPIPRLIGFRGFIPTITDARPTGARSNGLLHPPVVTFLSLLVDVQEPPELFAHA